MNPQQLAAYGLGLEDVRTALQQANANVPKGQLSNERELFTISADDQLLQAAKYKPLIVAYRNGAPVRPSNPSIFRTATSRDVPLEGRIDF